MAAFDDIEFWTAADGARLALRREPARGTRRAAIGIVHGFGEHSGRYAHVAAWFAARGVSVYAFDQRGHGRSPGPRGHIARFAQYLSDVVSLRRLVLGESPGPQLLLGHSFGGLVVLRYLETGPEPLAGAAVTSPFLAVAMKVPAWKRVLADVLGDVVPSLPVSTGMNLDWLATDAAVGRAARADPLCHQVMTPRCYREIQAAQRHVVTERAHIATPLWMGLAGDDRIVSRPASLAFATGLAPAPDLHEYAGLFHEILNEPRAGEVLADLAPWVDRVLEAA